MSENIVKIRDMIRELFDYNLNAEFEIIGNDGYPIKISDLNVGWQLEDDGECAEEDRDIYLEKKTCTKVTLFPNNQKEHEQK